MTSSLSDERFAARLPLRAAYLHETRSLRVPEGPFPIWMFRRLSGVIVAANDAAVRAFGYTRDDLLTRTLGDLSAAHAGCGDDLGSVPPSRCAPWVGRVLLRRRDGSTFEADVALLDDRDLHADPTLVVAYPAEAIDA